MFRNMLDREKKDPLIVPEMDFLPGFLQLDFDGFVQYGFRHQELEQCGDSVCLSVSSFILW